MSVSQAAGEPRDASRLDELGIEPASRQSCNPVAGRRPECRSSDIGRLWLRKRAHCHIRMHTYVCTEYGVCTYGVGRFAHILRKLMGHGTSQVSTSNPCFDCHLKRWRRERVCISWIEFYTRVNPKHQTIDVMLAQHVMFT